MTSTSVSVAVVPVSARQVDAHWAGVPACKDKVTLDVTAPHSDQHDARYRIQADAHCDYRRCT
eukprot:5817049-Pleurochrysis_carterae.AAC.1